MCRVDRGPCHVPYSGLTSLRISEDPDIAIAIHDGRAGADRELLGLAYRGSSARSWWFVNVPMAD
jgi:hypothetical protein